MAAKQTVYQIHVPPVLMINGVAISTSPSCILSTEGFNHLEIEVDTAWASATNVRMVVETSQDVSGTPTWRAMQAIESAGSGAYTSYDFTLTKTVAAADHWGWHIDVNSNAVKLTFTNPAANAGAGDTITIGVKKGVV